MKRAVFSIVVPAFEKYLSVLADCLNSVLKQGYSSLELILVCANHACDGAVPKDNRIRIFYIKEDDVCSKRNKGIEEAKGDYVLFLDADDYLHHDILDAVANEVDFRRPDIVAFGFTRDPSDMMLPLRTDGLVHYRSNADVVNVCFRNMFEYSGTPDPTLFDSACGKAWSRSLLLANNARFVIPPVRAEDAVFSRSLYLSANSISILPNAAGYYWRKNPVSTMYSVTPAWLNLNGYLEHILPIVKQTPFYKNELFFRYGKALFYGEIGRWKKGLPKPLTIRQMRKNLSTMYTGRKTLLHAMLSKQRGDPIRRRFAKPRWLFIWLAPLVVRLFY